MEGGSPDEVRHQGQGHADDPDLTLKDEWMTFNVGGAVFLTRSSTMGAVPNTLLSDLTEDSIHFHRPTRQYLFDRNPYFFQVSKEVA